jgi:metal-responsive CopG/Arc/MetJ family transcriptional regulator
MGTTKIAISIDKKLVRKLDRMVDNRIFANRSRAIQQAVEEKIIRMEKSRLARECAKLNPDFERMLADEGLLEDQKDWPEY